jgi:hypothetical protein
MLGENLMELWGGALTICEESTESFWKKCSTTFPFNNFLTNSGERVSLWHEGSTTISIQNSEKLRESVRVCFWDKMLNEHFHSNPQGGRDLFTHTKK